MVFRLDIDSCIENVLCAFLLKGFNSNHVAVSKNSRWDCPGVNGKKTKPRCGIMGGGGGKHS